MKSFNTILALSLITTVSLHAGKQKISRYKEFKIISPTRLTKIVYTPTITAPTLVTTSDNVQVPTSPLNMKTDNTIHYTDKSKKLNPTEAKMVAAFNKIAENYDNKKEKTSSETFNGSPLQSSMQTPNINSISKNISE